MNTLIQI